MNNTNYTIHDFMVDDLKLSGVALSVYALIYSFTRAGSDCHGSLEYIAERVGAARASVHRALTQLLEKQYIVKLSKSSRGTCRYKANLEFLSQNETEVVSKCDGGSLKMRPNNKEIIKEITTTTINHSFTQEQKPQRLAFFGPGKVVMMTYHQYADLLTRVGVLPTLHYIRTLEKCIVNRPDVIYKNHYQTILKWAREDAQISE